MLRKFLVLLVVALQVSTASAFEKPPFPRLAAVWTGNQVYDRPEVQAALARGSISLINGWQGWGADTGTTIEQVARKIHALNPNSLVFHYFVANEIPAADANNPIFAERFNKLNSMNWWQYATGTAGPVLPSGWPGALATNITNQVPRDSSGDSLSSWYAKWAVRTIATPSPSLDGLSQDNFFWRPRVWGDFDRNGLIDDANSAQAGTWARLGLKESLDTLKRLMPGKYQIANADWGGADAVFPELQGQLNGGFMEGMLGFGWSPESWGGFGELMRQYRKLMAAYGEPKLGIFHQVGGTQDYQNMRYGLATCLMDDGYFAYNSDVAYGDAPMFDEYNAKLGFATGAPPTGPWQNGVWRRDFEYGVALVNPKGNGQKTVQLETDFRKLSGAQAPAVNNGQMTRAVTLNDRDGIILMKLNATARPAAPSGMNVK
jgi:Hypothetical glycosyl hydrolase family 15